MDSAGRPKTSRGIANPDPDQFTSYVIPSPYQDATNHTLKLDRSGNRQQQQQQQAKNRIDETDSSNDDDNDSDEQEIFRNAVSIKNGITKLHAKEGRTGPAVLVGSEGSTSKSASTTASSAGRSPSRGRMAVAIGCWLFGSGLHV
jgi:hypothetical protein